MILLDAIAKIKKANQVQSNAGFTLIEIIVVLLIIGILSAIVAPSWLGFLARQRVNKANDAIFSAIQEAQRQAIKNKLSYSVSFEQDTNQNIKYAIYPTPTHTGTTLNIPSTWQSLNNNTGTDFGKLILSSNMTAENTSVSTVTSYSTSTTTNTSANTPTITFDYMGAIPSFSSTASSSSSTPPGLRVIVALPQSPNSTTASSTQRCVIVQTLLGGKRTAKDTACTPS